MKMHPVIDFMGLYFANVGFIERHVAASKYSIKHLLQIFAIAQILADESIKFFFRKYNLKVILVAFSV